MLTFDLSLPKSVADGATSLVLLHGRGSHGGDLQALRPLLPESWALVTPQAPHPGLPWGYGPGWAWYRYEGEDRADAASLERSLRELDDLLAGLPSILGFAPGRTVLGGFSQGGTLSTAYALTRPGAVAGVLNLSGFLVDSPAVRPEVEDAVRTPIFWAHGLRDLAVPHSLAAKGRARLAAAGARLTVRDYDIAHAIHPMEIADAVRFVEALQ